MNIYIKTFGCKVNSFESAAMAELLTARGCELTDSEALADAVIVNSCTVTSNSDKKTLQYLRRVKRDNPGCALMLCGCFAQAFPERAAALAEADVVCGAGSRAEAVEALLSYLKDNKRRVAVARPRAVFEQLDAAEADGHTRAFLKIEDGCERYCSYCIVPYARGPVRSLPLGALRARAEELARAGFAEIVLSGINLSCYGGDIGLGLADAVEAAASVEGITRVRLGSLQPDMTGQDALARLARVSKLCPHFHFALQSGCDETLARMNRHYTAEKFSALADGVRALFERPAFTTDVIVGFPGETEEEFLRSLAFVSGFGFLKVHVFPYSRRDGTRAAELPCQIPQREKERRAALMGEAAERSRGEVMRSFVGAKARVIPERPLGAGWEGYTDRYLPALALGEGLERGLPFVGVITRVVDGRCVVEAR